MGRPGQNPNDKLDSRIAKLCREILKAERVLVRETKKRKMPCQCQRGGYIYTQDDFEEVRALFEVARTRWLVEHNIEADRNIEAGNA